MRTLIIFILFNLLPLPYSIGAIGLVWAKKEEGKTPTAAASDIAVNVTGEGYPKIVPCSFDDKKSCIEYGEAFHRKILQGLERGKSAEEQAKNLNTQINTLQKTVEIWKGRERLWDQERASRENIDEEKNRQIQVQAVRIVALDKEVAEWRSKATAWYKHPVVWLLVGTAAGIAVVLVVQNARVQSGPTSTTTGKILISPNAPGGTALVRGPLAPIKITHTMPPAIAPRQILFQAN